MALRLRRGIDAERLLMTPVEGELIYTTDTKLLYVGDGSTAGGTLVTGAGGGGSATLAGLTDTDLTGVENNQVLTYLSGTNKWEPTTLPGVGALALNDLTNVNTGGVATWDVLQYDGVNFVPKSIDEALATDNDGSIEINTVGIHTGNVIGNVTGNVTGDVTGSVFADDSTLLVDAIAGILVGDVDNNSITTKDLIAGPLTLSGTGEFGNKRAGIEIISDGNADDGFSLFDITSSKDSDVGSAINITRSRGTPAAKTGLQDEDEIMGINYFGYDSDNAPQVAAVIQVTVNGTVTSGAVPGSILLATANAAGTPTPALLIDSNQATNFQGPAKLHSFSTTTARDAAITSPEAGMMIYLTATNKAQVYNGTAWTDLH